MPTVLFDFDGTIADTLPAIVKLYNSVHEKYGGRAVAAHEVSALRELGVKELLASLNISLLKFPFMLVELQKKIKVELPAVQLFPGLAHVLEQLHSKGFRLGIVTSNTVDNVRHFLDSHNITFFDFVYGEKEYWSKGRKIAKVVAIHVPEGEKVVYVGDEVRDIVAAQEAGLQCISVPWGFNSREKLLTGNPTVLVETPADLLEWVTENVTDADA